MSEIPEGCQPSDCCGDPSAHEITAAELELARSVGCARCQAIVVDEPSKTGTVMINYYIPALGVNERVYLCGACGLGFGEYLNPAKLNDPIYLAVKAELQSRWT